MPTVHLLLPLGGGGRNNCQFYLVIWTSNGWVLWCVARGYVQHVVTCSTWLRAARIVNAKNCSQFALEGTTNIVPLLLLHLAAVSAFCLTFFPDTLVLGWHCTLVVCWTHVQQFHRSWIICFRSSRFESPILSAFPYFFCVLYITSVSFIPAVLSESSKLSFTWLIPDISMSVSLLWSELRTFAFYCTVIIYFGFEDYSSFVCCSHLFLIKIV